MTWEKARNRWRKMHKGHVWVVTPEQLGVAVPTKEASWKRANEWWVAKAHHLMTPALNPVSTTVAQVLERTPLEALQRLVETGKAAGAIRRMLIDGGEDPLKLLASGINLSDADVRA